MTTVNDAWPVLRALVACGECGGTGTIDENVCERCEASPNVGWPFRVDPDLVSIDGDTMPGEPDRYFVVIDPEDVWGLPS